MSDDPRLLEATRSALARYGWEGATLERIASEAGLSRVTLYRRGVTKEGLVAALAEQAVEAYRLAVWPALTSAGSGAERLERALTALCVLIEQNLELVRALDSRTNAAVFHEPDPEALTRQPFTEPLERLLRDGVADGTLATDDVAETATTLFNLVSWTYLHLRAEHGWPAERARRSTLGLVLNGLLSR